MITLTCPCCAHAFPVFVLESRGFCKCGMDYELRRLKGSNVGWVVEWTPDPDTASAGAEPASELHVVLA